MPKSPTLKTKCIDGDFLKARFFFLITAIIISIVTVFGLFSYAKERRDQIIFSSLPYVLKKYEDGLAVQRGKDIVEVFDEVEFSALPEYDRNALQKGIEFGSMAEVYSAIEDYDG